MKYIQSPGGVNNGWALGFTSKYKAAKDRAWVITRGPQYANKIRPISS